MRVFSFLILIAFSFPSEFLHQNGENWKTWKFDRKVGYVDGFLDGFDSYETLLDNTIEMEKRRDPYWLPPLVITVLKNNSEDHINSVKEFDSIELAKRLDGFYYEPDNFGIKITDAIKILNLRKIGKGKIADDFIIDCQKKYLQGK
tara:strand:+ start:1735 stop:2172 length:438 start_codon:yes stop_codon:yes gene_type:complete